MSDINSKAVINLEVNGRDTGKVLEDLKNKAKNLETALRNAEKAGDKVSCKNLRRELNSVKRDIRKVQSASESAEMVMRKLDKATPKELRSTLRTLQKDLEKIERGSKAWNAQTVKIKQVKEALGQVNRELRMSESRWTRLNRWLNDCQTSLMGFIGMATGLVLAGKSAVRAYAEMEQEEANVRKFTGMTAEEVSLLNDEFKKMNTRTSREELNKLAQEAGRLGKSSQEDVLGFVRAADKVNVALDDLGSGATLKLSKIAGIFGDEERLGTEKALLSIGSVINELSQNCSASAPYIAEFTTRMGGVGSQANLTVQQIMAFAAVLDSNNQKLEASSTALSQVIVRIYQDPAKYAKVAGMDVKRFSNLVKSDMNSALLEFLSTLKKAGNMDVLSPMFKDMGENGSRAISALSTLANHIQEVKDQQKVANEAFAEAISIDAEFDVQNNTVQAGIDKAKKKLNELAITLGEKLMPVLKYAYSSSSMFLRTLNLLVDFTIKYHKEIILGVSIIAAYTAALKLHNIWLARVTVQAALADKAQKAMAITSKLLAGAIATCRLAAVALTNALLYLKNGFEVNYTMQQRWSKAMSAMKFSVWTGLILAVASAVYIYYQRQKKVAEESMFMEKIRVKAVQLMTDERANLNLLISAAKNEALSLDERKRAIEKLNEIIPDYNASIDETTGKYNASKEALDKYCESLTRKYELEGAEEKLKEIGKEKANATVEYNEAKEWYDNAHRQSSKSAGSAYTTSFGAVGYTATDASREAKINFDNALAKLKEIEARERKLLDAYGVDLQKKAVESVHSVEELEPLGGIGNPDPDSHRGKFAAEDEWKAIEEAKARIAKATGKLVDEQGNSSVYTLRNYEERMLEIQKEYLEKKLAHQDLENAEKLSLMAEYEEHKAKMSEDYARYEAEQREKGYGERVAFIKQSYADELLSTESYHRLLEQEEVEHLERMAKLAPDGSKEKEEAEEKYQQKLFELAQKRIRETEKLEQERQSRLEKVKSSVFGNSQAENDELYNSDLDDLLSVYAAELLAAGDNADEKLRIEEAFQQAKLALLKKYNKQSEDENGNALESMSSKIVDWMDSEGGQAVTKTMSTVVSGMSGIFSQMSSMVQAELEQQTAIIEKKYERELALAEGNSFKVAQLEKQKQKDLAKAKNEANKKMYSMQVMMAVAQTAQNALNAYGSAAAIPLVGHVMAPIAAAMAVAAGAIQIAAIKKQQQASQAQGYAQGGFTRKGRVDEEAGIVHAGEWVASQKLVNSPSTRPMIDALEHAQRTNTMGAFSIPDTTIIRQIEQGKGEDYASRELLENSRRSMDCLSRTVDLLAKRLDEPFMALASAGGENGFIEAKEDYERMLRNKSPKSLRK